MSTLKLLTDAVLFAPAADKWALNRGIVNSNGGLLVLSANSNLSEISDDAAARRNIGVEIGVDVQPYSSTLAAYAANPLPSSYFFTLTGLTSGDQVRNAIGAGAVSSVAMSGGTTGLSVTGGPITTTGTFVLGGVLNPANGGTGVTSLVALKQSLALNNVDNTSDLNKPVSNAVSTALSGKFDKPTGQSTDYVRGDGTIAAFPTIPAGGIGTVKSVNVSGGTTGLTFSGGPITTSGSLTAGGVLNVANGGTGTTTLGQLKIAMSLDAVDNTSDVNKPVSGPQATALTRKLTIPDSIASGQTLKLPNPVASNVLAWDSTGTQIVNFDASIYANDTQLYIPFVTVATGDNATSIFTLNGTPGSINNISVTVGGIAQTPGDDYTWDGANKVVFTSPPPTGEKVIIRFMKVAAANITPIVDTFTTDGFTYDFQLSQNPGSLKSVLVIVGGIVQFPGIDYTWDGNRVISFVEAPPADARIYIRYTDFVAAGTTAASMVTTTPLDGTVVPNGSTVQQALQSLSDELTALDAISTPQVDTFVGNASTKTFTLTYDPGSRDNLLVSIGGVVQTAGDDYTWTSGRTLTFTSAPPAGQKINVRYGRSATLAIAPITDVLTSDGTSTTYYLSDNPKSTANMSVSVGGVVQAPVIDYNWGGNNLLIFTSPPPTGLKIVVKYSEPVPLSGTQASLVSTGVFTGGVLTSNGTVQTALQSLSDNFANYALNTNVNIVYADSFTTDGTTRNFVLNNTAGSINAISVYLGGLAQTPGTDFTWDGNKTITLLGTIPASQPLLVKYTKPFSTGVNAAGVGVSTFTGSILSSASNVQNALQMLSDKITALISSISNPIVDKFTGNGSTVNFTLSRTPASLNALTVSDGGVVQVPTTDYTWTSGTTITFTTAPTAGAAVVVKYVSLT